MRLPGEGRRIRGSQCFRYCFLGSCAPYQATVDLGQSGVLFYLVGFFYRGVHCVHGGAERGVGGGVKRCRALFRRLAGAVGANPLIAVIW